MIYKSPGRGHVTGRLDEQAAACVRLGGILGHPMSPVSEEPDVSFVE